MSPGAAPNGEGRAAREATDIWKNMPRWQMVGIGFVLVAALSTVYNKYDSAEDRQREQDRARIASLEAANDKATAIAIGKISERLAVVETNRAADFRILSDVVNQLRGTNETMQRMTLELAKHNAAEGLGGRSSR